jgi:uncharacterized protein YkwD
MEPLLIAIHLGSAFVAAQAPPGGILATAGGTYTMTYTDNLDGDVTYQTYTVPERDPEATSAPEYPEWQNLADFQDTSIERTNYWRKRHDAPEAEWDDDLYTEAYNYLLNLDENIGEGDCPPVGDTGSDYGENMVIGQDGVTESIDLWAAEREDYSFEDAEGGERTANFTQLVWKDSTTFACAHRFCGEQSGYIYLCYYEPPGNVRGEFEGQVGREVEVQVDEDDGALKLLPGSWFAIVLCLSWIALL